jgi:sulfate adenylyltransferase subunit 1 (EFTu-like GTPase family)
MSKAKQSIRVPVDEQSCCRKANRFRTFRGDIKIGEVERSQGLKTRGWNMATGQAWLASPPDKKRPPI